MKFYIDQQPIYSKKDKSFTGTLFSVGTERSVPVAEGFERVVMIVPTRFVNRFYSMISALEAGDGLYVLADRNIDSLKNYMNTWKGDK